MGRAAVAIAALATALLAAAYVATCSGLTLYVYGDPHCSACRVLKDFLDRAGIPYYFCPLSEKNCTLRYYRLVKEAKIPPYIPVTLVISEGGVKAVVVGAVRSEDFWRSLAMLGGSEVAVYNGVARTGMAKIDPREALAEYAPEVLKGLATTPKPSHKPSTPKGGVSGSPPPIALTLAALVGLALSDAVNPCATYIYILLVTATALTAARVGRRGLVVATGGAFIGAVYVGYFLLGIGLLSILTYVPTWALSAIAIGFGAWVIATGILGKSRVVAKGSIINLVRRAKASVALSALLGLLVTFTLLPCSSGPYIVFAGLASRYPLPASLALIAAYNLIFIAPLAAITAVVATSMRFRMVQEFIVRHDKHMSVIAGAMLVAIGVYLLFTH